MTGKKPAAPDADQARRFEEAARAVGADEDEQAFRQKLAVIARQKPQPAVKAKPAKKPKA